MEEELKQLKEAAARAAILRVTAILLDDQVTNADALKAAALVFDKMYREEDQGAFEISME